MNLVQLPNGDWCDPSSIKAVRAIDGHYCDILKQQFHPRVVVEYGSGGCAIHHYESFDLACLARDKVAADAINLGTWQADEAAVLRRALKDLHDVAITYAGIDVVGPLEGRIQEAIREIESEAREAEKGGA